MSLINAYEVRYFSPAGPNYDVNQVNRFIETKERHLGNECLGWTFYSNLVSSKITYTGTDWSNTATYTTGQAVNDTSTGILYRALQNVPVATPLSDINYWEKAPKFSSTTYEALWENGLRDYLAIAIYRASLAASTYKGTSQGVTRHMGSGSESVTMQELSYVNGSLKDIETEAYANLVAYLKRNAATLAWNSCNEEDNCKNLRQKTGGFIFGESS